MMKAMVTLAVMQSDQTLELANDEQSKKSPELALNTLCTLYSVLHPCTKEPSGKLVD